MTRRDETNTSLHGMKKLTENTKEKEVIWEHFESK